MAAPLLTPKQLDYWHKLPHQFTYKQADSLMGKANFKRLFDKLNSLGVLERISEGLYQRKV